MSRTSRSFPVVLLSLSLILLGAGLSSAQVAQAVPFTQTGDLLVIDNAGNQIWRFMDLDLDGDWNDAGEIVPFFAGAPGIAFSNPTNIAVGPDGAAFVCDSTNDFVVRLHDLNGDGVATGPGEASIFFSAAANGSGVTMPSALGITVSEDGAVWISNSNTSTLGTDTVIRVADGNGDLDAEDAGEATEYARFAVGQTAAVSLPFNVAVGSDGAVYYLENGTAGKGIYRLHDDVVPNGLCTDAGEVSAFYLPLPPAPTPAPQYQGIASDRNGNFWITDTGFDRILRVRDLDSDQNIAIGGAEESVFFQLTVPSTAWNLAAASNGSVFVVEDGGTSERIFRLTDLDADGNAAGAGESQTVYDDTVASVNLGSIRSLAFLRSTTITLSPNPIVMGGAPACFGARAGAYDLMNVWGSNFPDAQLVPPYGLLGISLAIPGAFAEFIPPFAVDATGSFTTCVSIGYDPTLLGTTIHLQAIGGPPSRLQLSNVVPVTFQ
jgi:hypothetical protein